MSQGLKRLREAKLLQDIPIITAAGIDHKRICHLDFLPRLWVRKHTYYSISLQ